VRFPPVGYDEVVQTYGDAHAYLNNQMVWEEMVLRYVAVPEGLFLFAGKPVHTLRCHHLLTTAFGQVINRLAMGGLWEIEYGGTYAYRLNRNQSRNLSTHSWGIAIDINPSQCPNGSNPELQDQRIVAAFREVGFTWGGTFKKPDPMHFQMCSGY